MEFNEYNEGELEVSAEESENRYETSAHEGEDRFSSIAIIAAILLLAIITSVFFSVFTEDSIPAWNTDSSTTTTSKPTTTTTTTTTSGKPGKPDNPETKYPYATVTDKTQFVATAGGTGLYRLDLSSDHAILIKLSDMTTVAHKYADELIYPASMTKVMTVVTALDLIEDIKDIYIFDPEVLSVLEGTESTAEMKYLYNEYGSTTYTVKDLLYGISYKSGADSVVCLLDYLNLSVSEFAELMNQKAKEIGMTNTSFGGAIGMDSENNQTTCRDIAALMAYAMENPLCRELFGGTAYRLDYIEMTYYNSTLHKTLTNMGTTPDKVLGSKYTLLAAKSGLETNAGYCLVSYIKNNETGECFVLVTAEADKSVTYPNNRYTILDMQEIFFECQP